MQRVIVFSTIVYFFSQSIASGHISFFVRKKGFLPYNVICIIFVTSIFRIFIIDTRIVEILVMIITYVMSLVMYYVHEFRGTNVNFSDISSINTAKEVASGYTYRIMPIFVFALLIIALRCVYVVTELVYDISLSSGLSNIGINAYVDWRIAYRVLYTLISVILFFVIREKISSEKYDYSIMAGSNEGYVYNFFSSIPLFYRKVKSITTFEENIESFITDLEIKDSYVINTQDTENTHIEDSIISEEVPHVIVVMNESFGSVHRRISTDIEVTPYFDSLKGVTKGNLYVNTFGGGTANTEFEFLTGMSIGNYPYPVMPYNGFVRNDKYSLARFFKNYEYKTIAMHPYTATNYHRDKVYKRFGFDEMIFFDSFKHKECVRDYVSDRSFYEEIIDKFNTEKSSCNKSFIFGISMQNHSGYKHFEGAKVKSRLSIKKDVEALDSYLSLMRISDDSLKDFIKYFDNEKEHVVILFFGDHNASFGSEINEIVYDKSIEYECSNTYLTPFFIYDNHVKADRFIEAVSANFLSLLLIDSIKLPYDNLHKILNDVYKNYSVYNYHKMRNNESKELVDIPEDVYTLVERKYLAY